MDAYTGILKSESLDFNILHTASFPSIGRDLSMKGGGGGPDSGRIKYSPPFFSYIKPVNARGKHPHQSHA
jgi:hypothetical protein